MPRSYPGTYYGSSDDEYPPGIAVTNAMAQAPPAVTDKTTASTLLVTYSPSQAEQAGVISLPAQALRPSHTGNR